MTFQLDTSGSVDQSDSPFMRTYVGRYRSDDRFDPLTWDDFPPFMQDYIEAAFQGVHVDAFGATFAERAMLRPAFHMLAPETLKQMIADCERLQLMYQSAAATVGGKGLWTERQAGGLPRFPPQTLQLCDDGKVRFA